MSLNVYIGLTTWLTLLGCVEAPPLAPDVPSFRPASDTGSPTQSPPNILLIFTDQHRADAMAVAGHPVAITPTLDSLASQGVLFNRMYTNGPVCRPARAAMMTGLYPHQAGVTTNVEEIDPRGISHVRRIRDEAGYHTALVGKAHLYSGNTVHADNFRPRLEAMGFEEAFEQVGPTEQTWRPTAYSDYLVNTTEPGAESKWDRLTDYTENYDFSYPGHDAPPWNIPTEDHADVYTGRIAADWLRDRDPSRPFYLQLNFPGPHKPFSATQEYRDLYDPTDPDFPAPVLSEPDGPVSPLVETLLNLKGENWDPADARQLAADYLAGVTLIDDAIGHVLDTLQETGELDNTWVVYSSDHGELLADHHLTGKIAFYEGSWRVPLIIRPPQDLPPWQSEALVDTVDMTASILEMAGLAPEPLAAGTSLVQKIYDGPNAVDANVHRQFILGANMGNFAIRTEHWKLTYDDTLVVPRPVELYDLENDPFEVLNRINEAPYADKVAELTSLLESTLLQFPAP
jgi:arylsulfatase